MTNFIDKIRKINMLWIVIFVAVFIIILCFVTIYGQALEIQALRESVAEMASQVKTSKDKISIMESSQNEHINTSCEKVIKKNNVNACILVGTVIVIGVIALICFGGVDTGNLGKSLNLSSCQSKTDLINHNILIDENPNFGLSISSMDVINDRVMKEVVEIGSITDSTCNKLETIFEQDNY